MASDGAASPGPISPAERIDAIDILRGIALLGVVAINAVTEFRVSILERFLPQKPPASPIDSALGLFGRFGVASALAVGIAVYIGQVFSAPDGCAVTATARSSGCGAR